MLISQGGIPQGTEWQYFMTSFFPGDSDFSRLYVEGDTLIKDTMCVILKREQINCNLRYYDEYIYTEDDKWFYYHYEDSSFYLLYDFGLDIGDTMSLRTWEYYENVGEYIYYRVDSIENVDYNGNFLKKYYCNYGLLNNSDSIVFDSYHVFSIIENIGHDENMFYVWDTGLCDGRHVKRLNCYLNPVTGSYINDDSAECMGGLLNVEDGVDSPSSIVFPNPFNSSINIFSDSDLSSIVIRDLRGKEVSIFYSNYTRELIISTADLENGIYFIEIIHKSGAREIKKMIKSD